MMGIKGQTDDNIKREPVLGLVYHSPGVLEIETRYKGIYFYDKSSDPPAETTYVLWNNGGILTFGSVPVTLWNDDGSAYLYPVTDGRGIQLKNSLGTESGYVYRNDDYAIVNSGTGGEIALQRDGTSYVVTANGLVNVQNASLKQIDSETYKFILENDAGTETALFSRTDLDLSINGGAGADVLLQYQSTTYLAFRSTGVEVLNAPLWIFNSESNPLTIQNDAGTETGYIYRDDNVLYVNSGTGGDLALQYDGSTKVLVGTSNVSLSTTFTMTAGNVMNFYNAGGTEFGQIFKNDTQFEFINAYDFLIFDGKTGCYFRKDGFNKLVMGDYLDAYAAFRLTSGNTVDWYNAGGTEFGSMARNDDYLTITGGVGSLGVKLLDSESYPLVIENDAGSETGLISRSDTEFIFNSNTGGEFAIQRIGTSYIYSANGIVNFANAYIKQMDSETYPIMLENDAGTETSTISRNDNGFIINLGSGALAGHISGSLAMGYTSAFLPGPLDRTIFDGLSQWGMAPYGGRIEQGAPYFEDEFWSGQIRQEWNLVAGGTGSTAAVAGYGSGWIILTTGALLNDARSYDWNSIYDFSALRRPTFEIRLKLGATATYRIRVGMQASGVNDFVWFEFDTTNGVAPTNWHAMVRYDSGGGAESDYDTSVPATTNEVVLRFEFSADDEVRFIIDGVVVATSSVTANVPQTWMQPVIYLETLAASTVSCDFDYVKIWQDRT